MASTMVRDLLSVEAEKLRLIVTTTSLKTMECKCDYESISPLFNYHIYHLWWGRCGFATSHKNFTLHFTITSTALSNFCFYQKEV